MTTSEKVFIGHAAADRALATAFVQLLRCAMMPG
jgi:hypothetical protein